MLGLVLASDDHVVGRGSPDLATRTQVGVLYRLFTVGDESPPRVYSSTTSIPTGRFPTTTRCRGPARRRSASIGRAPPQRGITQGNTGREGEGVAQLPEPTAKRLQRPSWRGRR